MPLNHQNTQDRLVWAKNKAQTFTIRSAYQVALRLKQPYHTEHSSVHDHGKTWRRIWKLNVPPKVGTFLRRDCSGYLPTRQNLQKKQIKIKEHCELYGHRIETTSNVLWECHWRGMFGPYSKVASINVGMRLSTSFSSSRKCNRNLVPRSWRSGPS